MMEPRDDGQLGKCDVRPSENCEGGHLRVMVWRDGGRARTRGRRHARHYRHETAAFSLRARAAGGGPGPARKAAGKI